MVDANDFPPKRPECLSCFAPRHGYPAGISSLQWRSTSTNAARPALIVKCAASNRQRLRSVSLNR